MGNDYRHRKLRLCYLNAQPQFVTVSKVALEKILIQLSPQIEIISLKNLEDPQLLPCDLLLVAAESIPEDNFLAWLLKFSQTMQQQRKVWIPAIFFASVSFDLAKAFMGQAHSMNWYFDILSKEELPSLPIRVANLFRIHDHLHELQRYQDEITSLEETIADLSRQIATLKA